MAEIGVTHRDHEFDAVIEVSWHPVRTADIQLFTTAIGEPEDTAVLQEAADKASDSDVVADAGDARDEAVLLQQLIDSDVLVNGFTREKGSLETVFMQLTDHEEERVVTSYEAESGL